MVCDTPPCIHTPYSKNIGDIHRARSGTDGLTDGQTDYMPPKVPFGYKKNNEQAFPDGRRHFGRY